MQKVAVHAPDVVQAVAFDGDLMSIYFGPLSDTCGYNANPFNPGQGWESNGFWIAFALIAITGSTAGMAFSRDFWWQISCEARVM